MDFELLSDRPRPSTFLEEWERLLTNRQAALQRWVKAPPHRLGWGVLALAALELALGARLTSGDGLSLSVFRQFAAFVGLILAVELSIAAITAQAAEIFKTSGLTLHLLTFFNIGLAPLLLLLPVTLLEWASGAGDGVRFFLQILLLLKVAGNWRGALELIYKFSKMQSALVLYAASALGFVFLLLAGYALLFNKLSSLLL